MKRWLAIIFQVVLAGLLPVSEKIPDQVYKRGAQVAITAAAGLLAKKTSETNPDGTPAQVEWRK